MSTVLPNDIITEIINNTDLPTLVELCKTSKLTHQLCNNNNFFNVFLNHRRQIACGHAFTYIIFNNQLYSFGANDFGQLGLGNYNFYDTPQLVNLKNPISVSCGIDFAIVWTKDGLYGCGENKIGQLGTGDNIKKNNKFRKIDLDDIIAVVTGQNHTLVLTRTGLYGFGYNVNGQLGLGNIKFMYNVPTRIDINHYDIKSIQCGDDHTIITTQNNIYGFGSNYYGQLLDCTNCIKPTVLNIKQIGFDHIAVKDARFTATSDKTYIFDKERLWGCGDNMYGDLGIGNQNNIKKLTLIDIEGVDYVSGGEHFTIFVKDSDIYGCGNNLQGQLSLQNKKAITSIPTWIGSIDYEIVDVTSGGAHTIVQCIIDDNYVFYAFGNNDYGQLGIPNNNGIQVIKI